MSKLTNCCRRSANVSYKYSKVISRLPPPTIRLRIKRRHRHFEVEKGGNIASCLSKPRHGCVLFFFPFKFFLSGLQLISLESFLFGLLLLFWLLPKTVYDNVSFCASGIWDELLQIHSQERGVIWTRGSRHTQGSPRGLPACLPEASQFSVSTWLPPCPTPPPRAPWLWREEPGRTGSLSCPWDTVRLVGPSQEPAAPALAFLSPVGHWDRGWPRGQGKEGSGGAERGLGQSRERRPVPAGQQGGGGGRERD